MNDRIETFTSRIFINDQQAKNRIKELTRYMETLRKEKEKAAQAGDWESFNRLKKELDKTNKELRSMQSSAQKVDNVLRTLDKRSVKEIKQTIASINREMNSGAIERGSEQWRFLNEQLVRCKQELKAIAEESKIASDLKPDESGLMGFLAKFNQIGFAITNLFGMGTGFTGLIAKVRDLTAESVNLAQAAEGVEAAFERINKPGLLDELKKATHGTVSELELMKQAVKFKDFNLPVEQLGLYLSFAQQKAKDTGESIDYLVNSIVTGLGRQSPLILDNLGLSAKQISEEAKKSGDFFGAVAKIIKERMAESGEYMETSMDRAAKATADLQNAQRELGAVLLPLKENADTLFKELQTGLLHTIKFLVQHREAVMTLVGGYVGLKAVVALYVAITEKQLLLEIANAAAKVKTAVATKASAAATAIATVAQKAWTTAVLLANAAATLFTRGLGAMRVQMALARMEGMALTASGFGALAAVITVVGVAAVGLYNILKKQNTALQEMSRQQRLVNQAEKEARMDASRQTSELNRLYEATQDTNRSMDERLSCVEKLKQQYPGYFGQLSNEAILAGQAAAQYRQLAEDIIKAAKARAYQEKIDKLTQENVEHEEAVQENKNWNTANTDKVAHAKMNDEKLQRTISPVVPGSTNLFGSDDNRRNLNSADARILNEYEQRQKLTQDHLKKIAENNQTIQRMTDEVIKNQPALDRINGTTPVATTPTGGGGNNTTDEYTAKADQLKIALDRQLVELKRSYQEKMLTEEQYHDESYKAEMTYLVKLQTLQQQYKQPTTDTENKMLDKLLAEESYQRTQKQKEMNDELRMLDARYKQRQTELNKMYVEGEINSEQAFNERKKQAEIDYQEDKLAIIEKYGGDTTDIENQISQRQVNEMKDNKAQMLKAFEERLQNADSDTSRFAIIEQMRQRDLISEEQYQQRRIEITQEAGERRMEIEQALAQEIGATLSSLSSLFQSLQQSELNKVQKRYDKQIEAARKAGKNTAKLEKQKEMEMAKIRKKFADKEFQIKVLEIMANTAVGITMTWAKIGFPWAIPLTALMAAQGAIQLAVAKQAQQQAQEVGYYSGGFTGGKRYKKEAGVVHEGEFVANHQAVNNPAVRPMLDFLDKAQKNNTIGSLTADDISRQLGQGGGAVVAAPVVNVQTDNVELRDELKRSREVNEHLLRVIEEKGIKLDFPLDTFHRSYKHFQTLNAR